MIPEMIPLLVDRDRAAALRNSLDPTAPVNTIDHPRAVVLAGGLHEARVMPSLLRLVLALEHRSAMPLAAAFGIVVLAVLATALRRRQPAATTAAVVGFASMGWWLLLIATWQATRGSVYSEVGALTAGFMAGLAGGAGIACRWQDPARRLPVVLAAGAALSALIATGIAIDLPLAVVPVLLASAGALTGAAFPGLARISHQLPAAAGDAPHSAVLSRLGVLDVPSSTPPRPSGRKPHCAQHLTVLATKPGEICGLAALSGDDTRRAAGVAFAADEIGAAIGAVVVGIIAIPWAGLTSTALGLGVLVLAAIPAVLVTARHEEARH
jgi:hypothetical protein